MSSLTMNIFDGNAFEAVTMTTYVNTRIPFTPTFLSELNLFTGEGVYTPNVAFEEEAGALTLIQSSPRGAPASQSRNTKAASRLLPAIHLVRQAVINADEVAGVRVPGTADQIQTAERLLYKRIEGPTGLKAQLAYTMEHLRLGAIDGYVVDADGESVLYDYFQFYGIQRPDSIALKVSTYDDMNGYFDTALRAIKRQVVRALNGFALIGASPVVLCGDKFYDAVVDNKETVKARQLAATGNQAAPDILSKAAGAFSSYSYGGFTFINYRSSDDTEVGIPDGEGRLFMQGVPGLFKEYFAPADTFEFVNTEGLPTYLMQPPEMQTSKARVFEIQSNPLPICLRPNSLLRLTLA